MPRTPSARKSKPRKTAYGQSSYGKGRVSGYGPQNAAKVAAARAEAQPDKLLTEIPESLRLRFAGRTVYHFVLPLPPAECSSNWHGHWAKKANAVKAYRETCAGVFAAEALRQRIPCPLPYLKVHLDFFQARVAGDLTKCISQDVSNGVSSFKNGQDALADAGIVKDDSQKHVGLGECRLHNTKKDHGGYRCVVVTLEVTPREVKEKH